MATTLDPYTLLDLVGELVRIVDQHDPQSVSQRRFNDEAGKHERFSILPRAQSICRILRQSWHGVVELSLLDSAERVKTLAMRLRAEEASWLTHEQGEFAIRLICRRLGGIVAVSRSEYRRERERLIGSAGRGGAELAEVLPTENQILALFGSWNDALTSAGVALPPGSTPERRIFRGTSVIEVLDRCYEHHHSEPTLSELALFAQANGIPLPGLRGRGYRDYVREWKEQRRAQGLDVPERPPAKRDRPDYGVDVGAAAAGERRKRKRWSVEEIEPWVDDFLDWLQPALWPTERHYEDWAGETQGAPRASILINHGGFTKLIDEGRQRRARRAAA